MDHDPKAAKAYNALIRETAPADNGEPGKRRAYAIGVLNGKGAALIGKRKPGAMGQALAKASAKAGHFKLLSAGEVVWDGEKIVLKSATPAASLEPLKKAFLEYYAECKVQPPSKVIAFLASDQWDAESFEEEGEDAQDSDDADDEAGETDSDETHSDPTADMQADIARLIGQIKSATPAVGAIPAGQALLKTAALKAGEAGAKLRQKDVEGVARLLQEARQSIGQALRLAAAPPGVAAPAGSAASAGAAEPFQPAGEPQAAFKDRLKPLLAEIQQAVAAGNPAADGARARIAEAGKLAASLDFAKANAVLDQAKALLAGGPAGAAAAVGAAADQAWRQAVSVWQSDIEAVDRQIAALQAALRATGDAELGEIAEFGLNAVTGGFKVPLMAVAAELRNADAAMLQAEASRVLKIVQPFRAHLRSDPHVAACDENPFGAHVSIRATLDRALAQMESAVLAAESAGRASA